MLLTRLRAEPRTEAGECLVRARGISPGTDHLELARRPVEARLDTADDAVTGEDREDVVAELALRLRDVHLEPVVEAEQRLGPVAVVDEPVEGGEEGDAVRHGIGAYLGMRLPAAFAEPHSESAEALRGEHSLGVAEGDLLDLRVPAFGEIPQPLSAGSSG